MTSKINYTKIKKFFKSKLAIVGISGGVDSALTAAILVKALGKEKVVGVMMPYKKQSDIDDSKELIKELGIVGKEINIEKMVEPYLSIFSENKLVLGNIMSRIRMIVLYAIANSENGLVAGTTNKSEMAIGYFTKHGDGGCDVEIIASLLKTDVWEMAKKMASKNCWPTLAKIANKIPTAGLWENQTDEKEMGFSYEILDKYLSGKKVDAKIKAVILKMEKRLGFGLLINLMRFYVMILIKTQHCDHY